MATSMPVVFRMASRTCCILSQPKVHGFTSVLRVLPVASTTVASTADGSSAAESWSSFAWGPDGSYKDFVNASVIVFLAMCAATGELKMPAFLVDDFVSLQAVCEQTAGCIDRACSVLRITSKDALTVRSPDPLMIDWMLLHSGLGVEGKATDFIKKYNASVFFDKSLELKDFAAQRQANLLNPERISKARKQVLRQRINASESFQSSGFSLAIMNLPLFWASSKMHSSSNALWQELGTTTEESCMMALDLYLERCDKGQTGVSLFKDVSKRALLAVKLRSGAYTRQHLHVDVVAAMVPKILKGGYNSDIDAILQDTTEIDEVNAHALDEHLFQNYAICEDGLELQKARGKGAADDPSAGSDAGASAGMSDAAWAMSQLEHSLARFQKAQASFALKKGELAHAEAQHDAAARSNSTAATTGFLDKFVKLMPFVADAEQMELQLPSRVQERVAEVAKFEGCSESDVLVNFFVVSTLALLGP